MTVTVVRTTAAGKERAVMEESPVIGGKESRYRDQKGRSRAREDQGGRGRYREERGSQRTQDAARRNENGRRKKPEERRERIAARNEQGNARTGQMAVLSKKRKRGVF